MASSIAATRASCTPSSLSTSLHPPRTQASLPLHNPINFTRNTSILNNNNKKCCGKRKMGSVKIRAMADTFGSRLEESVKKTITENPVVVYSKTWCSYSSEVKSLFKRLDVEPLVIELDQMGPQGPQLQKVLERLTGQHTVPNVFVDTVKLHRKGELEPLLSEAGAGKTEN